VVGPITSKGPVRQTFSLVKVSTHSFGYVAENVEPFTQPSLDHDEPFNATATTPAPPFAGFSGPDPQSAYPDGSSNQPSKPAFRQAIINSIQSQTRHTQSGLGEGGSRYVSSNTAQLRSEKAALVTQQHQYMQQPVIPDDSGTRFNENEEAGPSRLPSEAPSPSHTPH
jgi:hypothetical protein